jgi:dolichol-phosphate mannosyltransferase
LLSLEKLVIIPTYNECENIESIIGAVMDLPTDFHVLIIDDGSPDGTANMVRAMFARYPGRLFLEERRGKLGLGTAYIHGFKWALARPYQYIFEMDADFSHNPVDLIRLHEACVQGADVAVGSRYIKGGKVKNWPFQRVALSVGASIYTQLITWMPVKDPTAGFVCYSRKVLEHMRLDNIRFIGYAFQIEMKFNAWKLGYSIKEVPITFIDRKLGASKMHTNIIKEGIMGVLILRWMSLKRGYKHQISND